MDWGIIATIIGAALAVIGFNYQILRNFKCDVNQHIDELGVKIDATNRRLDGHAQRIDQLYVAYNQKFDAYNQRLDDMYSIIIKMLDKK